MNKDINENDFDFETEEGPVYAKVPLSSPIFKSDIKVSSLEEWLSSLPAESKIIKFDCGILFCPQTNEMYCYEQTPEKKEA